MLRDFFMKMSKIIILLKKKLAHVAKNYYEMEKYAFIL